MPLWREQILWYYLYDREQIMGTGGGLTAVSGHRDKKRLWPLMGWDPTGNPPADIPFIRIKKGKKPPFWDHWASLFEQNFSQQRWGCTSMRTPGFNAQEQAPSASGPQLTDVVWHGDPKRAQPHQTAPQAAFWAAGTQPGPPASVRGANASGGRAGQASPSGSRRRIPAVPQSSGACRWSAVPWRSTAPCSTCSPEGEWARAARLWAVRAAGARNRAFSPCPAALAPPHAGCRPGRPRGKSMVLQLG